MVRTLIADIVEQHAEEAAFLWILRNEAIRAPNQNLRSLADLDERIDAHLDGLHVAGAAGWETCQQQLAWREAGEVFAAAHVALQSRIEKRFDVVLEIAVQSEELTGGMVGALAWLPFAEVEPKIRALAGADDPLVRRVGLAAYAAHRRDPGAPLDHAVIHSDASLRTRAIKAAAELGRCDLLPLCIERSNGAESASSYWHAWSASLLGDVTSNVQLRQMALAGGPRAEGACDLVTRRMSPNEARTWHAELMMNAHYRLAIVVTRASGDPAFVSWLIDVMGVQSLARIAAEAFTAITGVDLTSTGLAAPRPAGFESGPNDDPNDDDVTIDPDEHLPWPRRGAIARWWSANQASYGRGTRYLLAHPIAANAMRGVLVNGRQRQRAAAALELVLGQPGQPLFETRARANSQLRSLSPTPA